MEEATQQYRSEEDILQQFIDETCVIGSRAEVKASELYHRYRDWAQSNGMTPMNKTNFGRKMTERFNKERNNKGQVYQGIDVLK